MLDNQQKQVSKEILMELLSTYQDEISPKNTEKRIKSWFDRNTIEGESTTHD